MRSTFDIVSRFTGTGSLAEYGFTSKIEAAEDLMILILDDDGEEVARFRGDGTGDTDSYLDSIDFNAIDGGGTVYLNASLTLDYEIVMLLANDNPVQSRKLRDKFSFTMKDFEMAFDYVTGAVQRAIWLGTRSLRLHDSYEADFDPQLPAGALTPNASIVIDEDGLAFALGPTAAELAAALEAAQDALDSEAAATASAASAAAAQAASIAAQAASVAAQAAAVASADAADDSADAAAASAAAAASVAASFGGYVNSGPFTVATADDDDLLGETNDSGVYRQVDYLASIFNTSDFTVAARVGFSIFFRNGAWELAYDNARYADAAVAPDVVFTVHAVTGQINAENNGADDVEINFKKTPWDA
jgi:hypothetical protein